MQTNRAGVAHDASDASVTSRGTEPRFAHYVAPWRQRGKIGWLLLWLVGVPVPVLLGLFLLRGCT